MLIAESSGGVSLLRPEDWAVVPSPDVELVIAAPPAQWLGEDGFRPNVTVTSFPFPGSAAQLSTTVLASLLASLTDPFLVSVELVPEAEAERRIEYTHLGSGGSIHCVSQLLLHEDEACVVTSSCASGQLSAYEGILDLILASATQKGFLNG